MTDVQVECEASLQLVKDKEVISELIQAVLGGLENAGFKCGGFNLHFRDYRDAHVLQYIQFHSLTKE